MVTEKKTDYFRFPKSFFSSVLFETVCTPLTACFLLVFFLVSCTPLPPFNPKIQTHITAKDLQGVPSAFPPLTSDEKNSSWGQELFAGKKFAQQIDYYRAITCFYRAKFFLSSELQEKKDEIEYSLILSYWLGGKSAQAIQVFEESTLPCRIQQFPAKLELLIALHESYKALGEEKNKAATLQILTHYDETLSQKLLLSNALMEANLDEAACLAKNTSFEPSVDLLRQEFFRCRKSPCLAMTYNAFLPGLGYAYIGQSQSAITSFTINLLTTAASYYYFKKGNWGAGAIFASLEVGWYLGGIYGAGLEAQEYNERLYRQVATPLLTQKKLIPVLMIETSF